MNILEGQVAIVTGGGRGIGRAIALALATAGAKVAVAARSTSQLVETVQQIEQSGGHALALSVDVTDPQGVKQMVAQVEQQLGSVDLLLLPYGTAVGIYALYVLLNEQGKGLFLSPSP